MTPTIDEKLKVVERLIEEWRWARDGHADQRQVYEVLKSIAKELGARRAGAPSVAEFELERRMAAVRASKTSLGYAVPAMVGLAQELVGRWQTVVQALRSFEERSQSDDGVMGPTSVIGATFDAVNRWRYAFRWWQSEDGAHVGSEAQARFNWAAGEDLGMEHFDDDVAAENEREFLRQTGRSTIKGVVQK